MTEAKNGNLTFRDVITAGVRVTVEGVIITLVYLSPIPLLGVLATGGAIGLELRINNRNGRARSSFQDGIVE